jgi:hypothetical protein
MKKLILISLNELNFEALSEYNLEKYPNLKFLIKNFKHTTSENEYHLLEPWIQWLTIYSGLSAKEHNVFRLGDADSKKINNIFNKIENLGLKVGAIMPMNLPNNLKSAEFFIPDPWTTSSTDGSYLSNLISLTLSKIVNTNATNKIGLNDLINLFLIFIIFFRFKNLFYYIELLVKSLKKKYLKAIFLDLLLNDIFYKLNNKKKTNFSNIFFNGIAHIQHHYFFNSKINKSQIKNPDWYVGTKEDPFEDMLKYYDLILSDYIGGKIKYIITTGLTQKLYDRKKYYYRIKNYKIFLNQFSIKFKKILPRMSRDFLIEFNSKEEAAKAEKILNKIRVTNDELLFNEIDNRGDTLFLTLTYPNEIFKETSITDGSIKINNFYYNVNLVAIKNGMHDQKGFISTNSSINFENNLNIKNISKKIEQYFKE